MIIDKLRKDIAQAIANFRCRQSQKISNHCQNHLQNISTILQDNNPLTVKVALENYSHSLAPGLIAWLPFRENNYLQVELNKVLKSAGYSELNILRAMVQELQAQPVVAEKHLSLILEAVLTRIERLEQLISYQSQQLQTVGQEMQRLKLENNFLSTTITELAQKNCQLIEENNELKKTQKQQYFNLKQPDKSFLPEKQQLKDQLKSPYQNLSS